MKIYKAAFCILLSSLIQVVPNGANANGSRIQVIKGKDLSICRDIAEMVNHPNNVKYGPPNENSTIEFAIPNNFNTRYRWADWVDVSPKELNQGWMYKDDIDRIKAAYKQTGKLELQKTQPGVSLFNHDGLEYIYRYKIPKTNTKFCTVLQGQEFFGPNHLGYPDCGIFQKVHRDTNGAGKVETYIDKSYLFSSRHDNSKNKATLILTELSLLEMVGSDKRPFLHINFIDHCEIR